MGPSLPWNRTECAQCVAKQVRACVHAYLPSRMRPAGLTRLHRVSAEVSGLMHCSRGEERFIRMQRDMEACGVHPSSTATLGTAARVLGRHCQGLRAEQHKVRHQSVGMSALRGATRWVRDAANHARLQQVPHGVSTIAGLPTQEQLEVPEGLWYPASDLAQQY